MDGAVEGVRDGRAVPVGDVDGAHDGASEGDLVGEFVVGAHVGWDVVGAQVGRAVMGAQEGRRVGVEAPWEKST